MSFQTLVLPSNSGSKAASDGVVADAAHLKPCCVFNVPDVFLKCVSSELKCLLICQLFALAQPGVF